MLSGLILSTSIFATLLCLQRTAEPLLLSVDMRTATSWPAEKEFHLKFVFLVPYKYFIKLFINEGI